MSIELAIGFLPLTDSAVLVAAHEQGFAHAQGLSLTLVRDISWATARDRLVYRQVQAAHMLAPLAIGVSLGLGGHATPLAAPFKLNLNGNQIVVSDAIAEAMQLAPAARVAYPAAAARALKQALATRQARLPIIGIVHRLSSHALLLRDWLASAGIAPDEDVTLRVLPPSFMAEALADGEIDGFCAGEPWGSIAAASGHGQTVAIGARIRPNGTEKILALRQDWMNANPDPVDRLIRALDAAAVWCDTQANHQELAQILSRAHYVNQPAAAILPALSGQVSLSRGAPPELEPDFLMFHSNQAGLPTPSQANWIYTQLVRWNLADESQTLQAKAEAVFRPDVYRRALMMA